MGVNKVVYNGNTLIDVSRTNVAADKLLKGYSAIGPNGELIEGSLEQQSYDFSEVNVTADKMLKGTYAFDSSGNLIEGSIDVDELLSAINNAKKSIHFYGYNNKYSFSVNQSSKAASILAILPPNDGCVVEVKKFNPNYNNVTLRIYKHKIVTVSQAIDPTVSDYMISSSKFNNYGVGTNSTYDTEYRYITPPWIDEAGIESTTSFQDITVPPIRLRCEDLKKTDSIFETLQINKSATDNLVYTGIDCYIYANEKPKICNHLVSSNSTTIYADNNSAWS